MLGTKNTTLSAADLLSPEKPFARLLGKTMGELFPGVDFLDCCVFDATGVSGKKGVMKTSLRIVWPSIYVDKHRAGSIRTAARRPDLSAAKAITLS